MPRNVNIVVVAQPNTIDVGQLLQISGSVTSQTTGANVTQSRIYMEIIDSMGRVVWTTSVIAKNDSQFTKLISTSELKKNTRFTIRVGINPKMIYQGLTTFQTSQKTIPFLIPLLALPALLIPTGVQSHSFLIYRTELDKRVCPICQPNEGKIFAKGSKDIIRIGPKELGGKTHWQCRCVYDPIGIPFNAAVAKAHKLREVGLMVMSIKKHKKQRIMN